MYVCMWQNWRGAIILFCPGHHTGLLVVYICSSDAVPANDRSMLSLDVEYPQVALAS
jgi:hypothetical protein